MDKEVKKYEVSFLVDDPLIEGEVLNLLNKIGATILFQKNAEKINLAYKIKGRTSAFFGYIYFETFPEKVVEFDKLLHQNKNLLRFMIVSDPFIRENKNNQDKKSETYNQKSKIKYGQNETVLTNEALEKKLEEILET
ncbi:MAG: 30S ribosomal protein S6 [Minisyncoccia bacterium]